MHNEKKSSSGRIKTCLLTINAGSSSIKFGLFQTDDLSNRWLHGKVDRIGLPGTNLTFDYPKQNKQGSLSIKASDHRSAAKFLIEWLEKEIGVALIMGVGHRVVHGMKYTEHAQVTQELLDELHRIQLYDPDHLPREIELIEAFLQHHPKMPQVACFDTVFHRTMPRVAQILPIPRRFDAMGVRRYGFHGLSYTYLMEELARVAGERAAQERVILAHLGNGASLSAIHGGRSIDTSMGFTPTAGIPMGTRPGDLDPGVALYLMRTENLTFQKFNNLINHESGLLGVSETSSDMRDLIKRQFSDIRAAEAVELFCYQVRKWIGAFAAVLGGMDTVVFAGGIGENSPEIRARICRGIGYLGVELDELRNAENAPVITTEASRTTVRVIRTDEELIIARTVLRILSGKEKTTA